MKIKEERELETKDLVEKILHFNEVFRKENTLLFVDPVIIT